MRKKSKIPINQSIHCTREGYRESRVKAATRANRITAMRCRARMYVMLDRKKKSWIVSRLELRHSHPCSAKKAVHYHEYRELTMHAKCVITDNDEAGIRPNKTYLALVRCVGTAPRGIITDQCKAMAGAIRKFFKSGHHVVSKRHSYALFFYVHLYANRRKWVPIFFKSEFWAGMRSTQWSESMHAFYGGFLHCKSGLVQFVHKYDNVLVNKEQKELEDDVTDSKGVIPCIGSTGIER
ncbi:hypothetical protein Ahy_B09g097925 [Arachis hypogaea]|uniref:Protein FAR1-RELATED SEQUENCE n=1 Tax=Arachis hypogaea TaxID=3818 RepID=A0A444XQ77_ARAHY|nr:hypothetical protein Ahy_B09g097925 [Arachis hypogaea]